MRLRRFTRSGGTGGSRTLAERSFGWALSLPRGGGVSGKDLEMWMGQFGWGVEDERKTSVGDPWAGGKGYSKRCAPRSKGVPMNWTRMSDGGGVLERLTSLEEEEEEEEEGRSGWWVSRCKCIIWLGTRGQPPCLLSSSMSLLAALWDSLVRLLRGLFRRSDTLPVPATCSARVPVFHPPQGPFPHISVSGILASAATPSPPSVPPCEPTPVVSPLSSTPTSAGTVEHDRSDASWEVIPLGAVTPVRVADTVRLPSPWSPIGRPSGPDVWMSADGLLVNASGPVDGSHDDSAGTATLSGMSSPSLYSTSSALGAFGISVLVHLDDPKVVHVRDGYRPTLRTPLKRRQTLSSAARPQAPSRMSHRATKSLSTPLTKLVHVDAGHSSIASMACLFADGKSMTGLENIISLLDQASPEATPQPVAI